MNTEERVLQPGLCFDTTEQAKQFMINYNKKNFTNFVIASNCKKTLVYMCKHGKPAGKNGKSSSTGKRPKQHYNNLGCEASIRMYKSKDNEIKH